MIKRILLLFLSALPLLLSAQTYKAYPLGESGCQASFPCAAPQAVLEYSPDSSEVYSSECSYQDVFYSLICVKLAPDVRVQMLSLNDYDTLLTHYLEYLKSAFHITASSGIEYNRVLPEHRDARGVSELWIDTGDAEWEVSAWCNGKYLSVHMVYMMEGQIPAEKKEFNRTFLYGIRFPK